MSKNIMKVAIVVALVIGLAVAVLSPSGAAQPPKQPLPCLYAFEWIHTFRFPLQADPRCAYSYVLIPKLPRGIPVGFLVEAEFPVRGLVLLDDLRRERAGGLAPERPENRAGWWQYQSVR